MRKGEHPNDVLERVVGAVMEMATRCSLDWAQGEEEKLTRQRILSAYNNLLLKDFDAATGDVPAWLPGEFHTRWIEALAAGARPCFGYNRGGFYIRKPQERAAGSTPPAQGKPASNNAAGGPEGRTRTGAKRILVLRPFVPFDPAALPQREWLYAKHYQRRTVSMTAGPGEWERPAWEWSSWWRWSQPATS